MIGRCDACPVAEPGACYARRANVRRLCELPEFAPLLAEWGAEGNPPPPRSSPPAPPIVLVGYPGCRHLSARWGCGGEMIANCALGLGSAGIIDEHDCRGCDRMEPAT